MIEDLSKDPHETVETPNASDRLPTKEIRDSLQRARQLLRVTKDHIRVLSCQQHCSEQCVDDPAEEEECMDACDEMSADEHPLDPARDFCLHGRNIRVS